MKKVLYLVCLVFTMIVMFSLKSQNVEAKELIASGTDSGLFGPIGEIKVYDNGEIAIDYKYGLRRVDVYYCISPEDCDLNIYSMINIQTSSIEEPFKNNENELATYTYMLQLSNKHNYKLKISAYFGTGSGYSGVESISGAPTIKGPFVVQSTSELKGENINSEVSDEGINNMLDDLVEITNTILLPIMYAVTGMVLVIKGTWLGVEIVKSADNSEERAQKVGGLKWLLIGVFIAFGASTLIGLLTGFFNDFGK